MIQIFKTKSLVVLMAMVLFPAIYIGAFAVTVSVGPSHNYKTPSSVASVVKDGDTVEIDTGTYTNEATIWRVNNLTLRGKSRFAHLIAPANIPNQKAIWVIQGRNTTIENIEFSSAKVPDQNGAGIRQEGDNCTIRSCYFHDNENGILGGGGTSSNLVIENSEFADNGYGDGYSHNLYIGHIASFTIKFCYTHHSRIGHLIKSRAEKNFILYNRIMDEANGTASYEVDLPNGGTSYLIGNLIQQGPATDNSTIVSFGAEGLSNSGKDLYVVNNTLVNERASGTFIRIASGAARAKIVNNLFVGSGSLFSGQADTMTNLVSSDHGFVNRATYDYRLTGSSPAINKGSDPGLTTEYALLPQFQYSYDCSGVSRSSIGQIDIGAFEFTTTAVVNGTSTITTARRHTSTNGSGLINLLGQTFAPGTLTPKRFQHRYLVKIR